MSAIPRATGAWSAALLLQGLALLAGPCCPAGALRDHAGAEAAGAATVAGVGRSASASCDPTDVRIRLTPVGTATTLRTDTARKVGTLYVEGEEEPHQFMLPCGDPAYLFRHNEAIGVKPTLLEKTEKALCIKAGESFELDQSLHAALLPDISRGALRLVPGTCLMFSRPDGPDKVEVPNGVVKTKKAALERYSRDNVKTSALLAVESWLWFASGSTVESLSAIQDGSMYARLHVQYASTPRRKGDVALTEQLDKDAARFHHFGDPRQKFPCGVDAGAAMKLIYEIVEKRVGQNRTVCWAPEPKEGEKAGQGKICDRDEYSQGEFHIVGSLLSATLEARAIAERAGGVECGPSKLDPAAVAFKLFSLYLDSDAGTFQSPVILTQRMEVEKHSIFDKHFLGGSMFASRPSELWAQQVQAHMISLIIQFYSLLALTSSNVYDSRKSTDVFWRYFLKTVDFKAETAKDKSVMFLRMTMLEVLKGHPVLFDPGHDEPLAVKDFPRMVKEWRGERDKAPHDFTQAAVSAAAFSPFIKGLKQTLEAPYGLAATVLRASHECLDSGRIWSFMSGC